jgi:hypothetical protein
MNGGFIQASAVLVSTDAKASSWLAGTGLATVAGGFLATAPTLASISDPAVFEKS